MPIYEFKCPSCGETKDVLMKYGTDSAQNCPRCGTPMFKSFSAPLKFDFRGGGYYETDFKGKK
jgi:putative FmdB family regulatory protein